MPDRPTPTMNVVIDRKLAEKVLSIVDAGLVHGLGKPIPGQMCVEAAVCYALGLPHGDKPPCVGAAVNALKIRLNDSCWSSDAARTKGMRELAIAQLGSTEIDQVAFVKYIAEQTIRQIVPIALRAAASMQNDQKHKDALEANAKRCEDEGTRAAATAAYAAAAAATAAYAAAAAATAAYAATADAANAAAATADAATAAAYAATATTANAAAYAANAANAAAADARDTVLTLFAKIAVEALKKFGALGVQWLDLCQ